MYENSDSHISTLQYSVWFGTAECKLNSLLSTKIQIKTAKNQPHIDIAAFTPSIPLLSTHSVLQLPRVASTKAHGARDGEGLARAGVETDVALLASLRVNGDTVVGHLATDILQEFCGIGLLLGMFVNSFKDRLF